MIRRLYLRLWLAFVAVLLGIVVASAVVFSILGRNYLPMLRRGPRIAEHLARTLPPPGNPEKLAQAVEQANDELGLDVAVVGPDGEELAAAGVHIPRPGEEQLERAARGAGWIGPSVVAAPLGPAAPGKGPQGMPAAFVLVHVPLGDFAPAAGRGGPQPQGPGAGMGTPPGPGGPLMTGPGGGPLIGPGRAFTRTLLFLIGGLILSAALLYPLSRSITRPLERLTAAAEAFGRGDLARRSGIVAGDEVGRLARAFDEMAARIEAARRGEKELLANVSHELRTPLQRVKLALELIEPPAGGNGEALRKRLASVGEEIDELTGLVSEILTASRLDLSELPLRRSRLDPREVLEKAKARAQALQAEPPVEVDAPEGITLDADEALIGRVLDNLIDNARKYGGGTPVRLEARGGPQTVLLAVSDGGKGFPPEELTRVFETFYRGSNARGLQSGYGLGLALARRVAEAHGGAVEAKNSPGGGARVELRLPVAGGKAAAPA